MNRKDFKNKSEMQIFLSYFKPHRKLFFLDMACALGIAMIDLAFPFISRWCMYKLLPDNAWRTFWTVMAIVFCAYILRSVFTYIITYLNLLSMGYSLLDYFKFIINRVECWFSIVGFLLVFLTIFTKGYDKNDIYL